MLKNLLTKSKLLTIISLFFGFFVASLNIIFFLPIRTIVHDSISWVLVGVAPLINLGLPYKNYFENKPPGLYLIIFLWSKLFGSSDTSFFVMHCLVLFILVVLICLLFRKINTSFLILPSIICSFIITFAPFFTDFIISSEYLALVFSLGGLLILLYKKGSPIALFLSTLLIFLSSQIRDTFGPTIICLIPVLFFYLLKKGSIRKFLIPSLAGSLTGLAIIISYLVILGVLAEYIEVLSYKKLAFSVFDFQLIISNFYLNVHAILSAIFAIKLYVLTLPLIAALLIAVDIIFIRKLISFKLSRPHLSLSITIQKYSGLFNLQRSVDTMIILLFILGNYIGLALLADPEVGSHRIIQVVLSSTILIFLINLSYFNSLRSILNKMLPSRHAGLILTNIVFFSLTTLFTFPRIDIFRSYGVKSMPNKIRSSVLIDNSDKKIYEFIAENTNQEDCILHYYGWAVGKTYYYSKRRPCTKYFFPAQIIKYPKYLNDLKEELKTNPPRLIYYQTDGANVDVEKFEREAVNLAGIVNKCYKSTSYKSIYLPKEDSTKKFNECYRSFFPQ